MSAIPSIFCESDRIRSAEVWNVQRNRNSPVGPALAEGAGVSFTSAGSR